MKAGALSDRLVANWPTKAALTIFMNGGFWVIYFAIQRYPLSDPAPMRHLAIDSWVPFLPWTIYMYLSLTFLLPLAPWFMESKEVLFDYARALGFMILIAFTFFYFWPTSCPRPPEASSAEGLYGFIVRTDRPLNAFPSLHAALAVFTSLCCWFLVTESRGGCLLQAVLWIWTAGILLSTLLTKQHVFLDLAGGCVLGAFVFAVCRTMRNRESPSRGGRAKGPLP